MPRAITRITRAATSVAPASDVPSPTASRATDSAEVPITDAPQLGAKDFRSNPPGAADGSRAAALLVVMALLWIRLTLT